jgi:hypothetical protein
MCIRDRYGSGDKQNAELIVFEAEQINIHFSNCTKKAIFVRLYLFN